GRDRGELPAAGTPQRREGLAAELPTASIHPVAAENNGPTPAPAIGAPAGAPGNRKVRSTEIPCARSVLAPAYTGAGLARNRNFAGSACCVSFSSGSRLE